MDIRNRYWADVYLPVFISKHAGNEKVDQSFPWVRALSGRAADSNPLIIGAGYISGASNWMLVADIHPQPISGRYVSANLPKLTFILSGVLSNNEAFFLFILSGARCVASREVEGA